MHLSALPRPRLLSCSQALVLPRALLPLLLDVSLKIAVDGFLAGATGTSLATSGTPDLA